MKFIAHRGNINGSSKYENDPGFILNAIYYNLDVEVDVWAIGNSYYLGHDSPKYKIDLAYFEEIKNNLWCHCKNIEALSLLKDKYNCFWHQNDKYTLTSLGYIWVYPGEKLVENSIALFDNYSKDNLNICYGICSDNILKYKGLWL